MDTARDSRRPARFAAAALAAVLSTAAMPAIAEEELPALVKKIQPAIVTITGYDEADEPEQLGTGFFVDAKGHLITNRHVLSGASRAEVKTQDGTVYAVKQVIAEDRMSDLIKVDIDIPEKKVTALKLTRSTPDPGSRIVVIGSPFGFEQTVSDGIVSTVRDIEPLGKIIQISAPISPGSSGSPVVDLKGRVVGIATVQFTEGQNLNFAVPGMKMIALKAKNVREFPDWASEALLRDGLIAAQHDDWTESIALLQRSVKTKPDYAEGYNALGIVYETLGKYGEAWTAYKEAIRIRPDYPEAHTNIGDVYLKQGNDDDAMKSYEAALAIKADHAAAIVGVGKVYLARGNQTGALAQYEKAKALDVEQANALFEAIYKPAAETAAAKPDAP